MKNILNGWNSWRTIRMLLSVIFIVAGIVRLDFILIAAGSYLFFQSLFNLGCAGGSCAAPINSKNNDKIPGTDRI